MKVLIVDRDGIKLSGLYQGLHKLGDDIVKFYHGSFDDEIISADAIVSPANSFGYMDGGIDLAFRNRWPHIEKTVQDQIAQLQFGELLVGQAFDVATGDDKFKRLIVAPTMRIPMKVPVFNIYLATRAAADFARRANYTSILFPGMGTGSGGLNPKEAGWAMYRGIRDGLNPNYTLPLGPNWKGVATAHMLLGSEMDS